MSSTDDVRISRVLVADDEEDMLLWLSIELSSRGWQVTTAGDGPAAVAAAATSSFELIVLDHQMPGQTGLEVARVLRAAGTVAPIALFSARTPAPIEELQELGVVPISKVDHQALLRLADSLVAAPH